jgi:hypothetical protein
VRAPRRRLPRDGSYPGGPALTAAELDELIASAGRRLESLALYPKPLRRDVSIVVWPWLFRLPTMSRYVAYAFIRRIALKETPEALVARNGRDRFERLLVHELCHIWQYQHHPIRTTVALLRYPYRENPYEQEARRAAGAA